MLRLACLRTGLFHFGGAMRAGYVCLMLAMAGAHLRGEGTEWDRKLQEAHAMQQRADYAGALKSFQELLTDIDRGIAPQFARTALLTAIGTLNHDLGNDTEALRYYRSAIEFLESRGQKNTSDYAMLLCNLATIELWGGRAAQAESRLRQAIEIYANVPKLDPVRLAAARNSLAETLIARNNLEEAEHLLQQALATMRSSLGVHERTAVVINNLGLVRRKQKRYQESLRFFTDSAAMMEAALGPTHPHTARAINNAGTAYAEAGDHQRALAEYRRAAAIVESTLGMEHPAYSDILANWAKTLRHLGKKKEAKDIQARVDVLRRGTTSTSGYTVDARDVSAFRAQ